MQMIEAVMTNPANPMLNRTIGARYPPGSTFKPITLLAGLESGVISPQDTVVDASHNAALCVPEDRAAGAQVTSTRTTGNHGDPSNFHQALVRACCATRSERGIAGMGSVINLRSRVVTEATTPVASLPGA